MHQQFSEFVQNICKNRDESHGYSHMENVAKNACWILNHLQGIDHERLVNKVLAVAWLHDVNDHKYHDIQNAEQKMCEFLQTLFSESEMNDIMRIISYISYTKEQNAIEKGNPINFEKELGYPSCLIRHIVSDADKLEAIGKIGLVRCRKYNTELYFHKHGIAIPQEELKKIIIYHAKEKLLRIKDEFIRTKPGLDLAIPLHNELIEELTKL